MSISSNNNNKKKGKSQTCVQTWINPCFSCLRINPNAGTLVVVIATLEFIEIGVGSNLIPRRRRFVLGSSDEFIESGLSFSRRRFSDVFLGNRWMSGRSEMGR